MHQQSSSLLKHQEHASSKFLIHEKLKFCYLVISTRLLVSKMRVNRLCIKNEGVSNNINKYELL